MLPRNKGPALGSAVRGSCTPSCVPSWIVLHRVLQWHHMLSSWYPVNTDENLELNTFWGTASFTAQRTCSLSCCLCCGERRNAGTYTGLRSSWQGRCCGASTMSTVTCGTGRTIAGTKAMRAIQVAGRTRRRNDVEHFRLHGLLDVPMSKSPPRPRPKGPADTGKLRSGEFMTFPSGRSAP